jgi:hypothetical protein
MPRRVSLLFNLLVVFAITLSGFLVDAAMPSGTSQATGAGPDVVPQVT